VALLHVLLLISGVDRCFLSQGVFVGNWQHLVGRRCNTPDVTVAAIVHQQCFYSGCYSINIIQGRWHFLLLKLDHLKSIGKFEFTPVHCGLIDLVSNFLYFVGTELDHTPKRDIVPGDLFYKYANLQKIWSLRSICFDGPNRANQPRFPEENFLVSA
jgi:hypothetical protein